ncbi:MAG: hypothetical protein AAFP82_20900, partial [Bacteroidota bacterium]
MTYLNTIISLIAAGVLLEEYFYGRESYKDSAVLWLALSFLVLVPFYAVSPTLDLGQFDSALLGVIISWLNNVFLLLAYPHFTHAKSSMQIPFLGKRGILNFEGNLGQIFILKLASIILILTMFGILIHNFCDHKYGISIVAFVNFPNTLFSCFSLGMICSAIKKSFEKRNRPLLSYISIITFILLICYQFYFVVPYSFNFGLLDKTTIEHVSLTFKIIYILLVYQLVSTSNDEKGKVKEVNKKQYIEIISPSTDNIKNLSKAFFMVKMSIAGKIRNQYVRLSLSAFKTLIFMINARKLDENLEEGGYIRCDHRRILQNDFSRL